MIDWCISKKILSYRFIALSLIVLLIIDATPAYADASKLAAGISTQIIGYVDGIFDTGAQFTFNSGSEYSITGWSCSTGLATQVRVDGYVGGPAGVGTGIFSTYANLWSEPAVGAACQDGTGTPHRFVVPVAASILRQFGGKALYVYGISPVNAGNLLLGNSGLFILPHINRTVYIGGVLGVQNLIAATNVSDMINTGKIGLYMHANGVAGLFTNGTLNLLLSTWLATGANPSGNFQAVGEVGSSTTIGSYVNYFGGRYPNEVNMNAIGGVGDGSTTYTATGADKYPGRVYGGYLSDDNLISIKASIDAAGAVGAKNVAVFMTPNSGKEDFDDDFATGGYWANVRAAAIYGGGLALDTPPNYAYNVSPYYVPMIKQMIKWCNANHIRSSLTISPFTLTPDTAGNVSGGGYQPDLLENTFKYVSDLAAAGALPTQYVVENYAYGDENQPMNDQTRESLNAVALLLSIARASPPGTAAGQFPGAMSQAQLELGN